MIYTNFVVLQTLMLHTKFQDNWPVFSGEEDFLRVWAFLSMATIFVIWSPWCYISKFRQNRSTGCLEKDFQRDFTIYGHGDHLGHVTSIMLINFFSMYLKAYIQNLVKNGPVVFEKNKFQYSYGNDLGLDTHVINLISCLHLPIFRSQAAMVSVKSTVFTF